MMQCTLFNTKTYIEKCNDHIITVRKMANTKPDEDLYEVSIDCFSSLPAEENIDMNDFITDINGCSIAGSAEELLNDNELDHYHDIIEKAIKLL